MTNTYTLIDESDDDVGAILATASVACSAFQLMTRDDARATEAPQFLRRLKAWQVSVEQRSEWPGTILSRGTAFVWRFVLNPDSAKILTMSRKPLSTWREPNLPEDLSLLRPDGSVYLTSTSHEKDVYFELSVEELKRIEETTPEFAARLSLDTPRGARV